MRTKKLRTYEAAVERDSAEHLSTQPGLVMRWSNPWETVVQVQAPSMAEARRLFASLDVVQLSPLREISISPALRRYIAHGKGRAARQFREDAEWDNWNVPTDFHDSLQAVRRARRNPRLRTSPEHQWVRKNPNVKTIDWDRAERDADTIDRLTGEEDSYAGKHYDDLASAVFFQLAGWPVTSQGNEYLTQLLFEDDRSGKTPLMRLYVKAERLAAKHIRETGWPRKVRSR